MKAFRPFPSPSQALPGMAFPAPFRPFPHPLGWGRGRGRGRGKGCPLVGKGKGSITRATPPGDRSNGGLGARRDRVLSARSGPGWHSQGRGCRG